VTESRGYVENENRLNMKQAYDENTIYKVYKQQTYICHFAHGRTAIPYFSCLSCTFLLYYHASSLVQETYLSVYVGMAEGRRVAEGEEGRAENIWEA